MDRYNFKVIENKWQKYWEKNKTFKSKLDNGDISALTYATVFVVAVPQIIGASSFFLTAYSEEIDAAQKSSKFSKSTSYILLVSVPIVVFFLSAIFWFLKYKKIIN